MESARPKSVFPIVYSLPFLLAFGLSVLMLATDKNLQTNFGAVSSGYFVHWYVVAVTAAADLVGAFLLLILRSRTSVKLGTIGSGLLVILFLGVVLTYQQVGFTSAYAFAQYLFGITYYGGDIRYLYDGLLATYIGTFLLGVVDLVVTRNSQESSSRNDAEHPATGGA